MPTRTVCQQCGVTVAAGARFCANCGADVSAEQGNVATRKFTSTQVMHDQLLERVRHAALGEYEILTELGRGGMATVYLAHDIQLDRKVALKVMLPALLEGEDMIERFRLEARTAAQLSHPHIIPIYAVRAADGLVYFVMKFVEGRPLDAILRELGQLPIPMVQSILSKVGEALGYAHRRGVVHRDIKPANLMIDIEGLPVVTDFGIAKVADTHGLTMTGAMMGTPTYMSPEQCSGGEITGASDQYSLGVLAYQMLGGKVPFDGDTLVGLLYKHVHDPPPSLLSLRPDCPAALHAAVMRMLAKDPKDRFPTIEGAVEAIGRVSFGFDDPVRTQLIGLARRGENVALIKRISTPISPPVPRRTKPIVSGAGLTPFLTPEESPVRAEAPGARPVAPGRALPVGRIATAAILVVGIGLAAWLRPWARGGGTEGTASDPGQSLPTAPVATVPPPAPSADPAGNTDARAPSTAPVTPVSSSPTPASLAPEVTPTLVASVRITAPPATLTVGESTALRGVAVDARGRALGDRVRWTVTDASRAAVTPEGVVTARAVGPVTLTARSGTASQTLTIDVVPVRAASVAVSAPPASLTVGASTRLSASPLDAAGRPVASGVSWRTADPRVATVDAGVVTAVGAGSTLITATADGREHDVTVRVVAPEVAAPPPAPAATPARAEPAPVDPREAADAAIQRYARALESRQLSEVRAAYPGLTPEQETQFTQTLRTLQNLRVRLRVETFNVVGAEATAGVVGEYEFYSPENRRTERLPVRVTATLDRGPTGWHIRSIR